MLNFVVTTFPEYASMLFSIEFKYHSLLGRGPFIYKTADFTSWSSSAIKMYRMILKSRAKVTDATSVSLSTEAALVKLRDLNFNFKIKITLISY